MKNTLFCHVLIYVGIVSCVIFLEEQRKRRKALKQLTKKLDETMSSIQAMEFDVELLGENYKKLNNSLKHLKSEPDNK